MVSCICIFIAILIASFLYLFKKTVKKDAEIEILERKLEQQTELAKLHEEKQREADEKRKQDEEAVVDGTVDFANAVIDAFNNGVPNHSEQ